MKESSIYIIIVFVASIFSHYLVAKYERKYQRPEIDSSREPVIRPHKQALFIIVAYSIFTVWMLVLVLLIFVLLSQIIVIDISSNYMFSAMLIWLGLASVSIFLSCFLRCKSCNRLLLFQPTLVPPYGKKIYGMHYWASIVISFVFKGKYQCMNCGQNYERGKNS